MEVRDFRRRDRRRLKGMIESLFINGHIGEEYIPEMVDEVSRASRGKLDGMVACEDGWPVGYAIYEKTTGTYKLETIMVRPGYHNKGIGRMLIEKVEEKLKNVTDGDVVLNVVTDISVDGPVGGFYESCGFKISGVVTDEYRPGDTIAHYSKHLQPKK